MYPHLPKQKSEEKLSQKLEVKKASSKPYIKHSSFPTAHQSIKRNQCDNKEEDLIPAYEFFLIRTFSLQKAENLN